MYKVLYSDKILVHLNGAYAAHPVEVETALMQLEENPMAHAISTGLPAIGCYYIPAVQYAIVFNIDKVNETIEIVSIRKLGYMQNLVSKRYR